NEPLFENLSFELKKGERMFIIGSNGCGKSTLLKIINGVINDYSGIFELGYSQTVGYYDQEIQLFNNDSTVIDELLSADEDLLPAKARAVLAQYGFVGDDVFKPITILSGGEKARLSIAKLVLKNVSLLILDEPTNHLDIPSKEVLESALLAYNGTLLTVSHDRYFISALATRILEIDKNGYDNGYFDFNGNFELFLQKRQKRVVFDDDTKDKTSKNEYLNTKRERSQKKSAQKRYDFLTLEIEKLENREKQIESELTLYSDDYEKVILLTSEDEQLKIDLEKNYEEYFSLEI
ncbi:MAG: ATP-binding cassette domain-containing protein, partial [Clostridia bacterium]